MARSTISNTILDPIGNPVANAVVVAKLMPFASFRIDTFTEVARSVQTTTNSSGFWSLQLERQANINPADTTWWEVTEYIPDAKGGSRTWNISVGASDQTLYASLITPAYSQPIIISTDQATYLTQQSADARYQALAAIGATPNTIEPDDAASAGVSASAARADHEHGIVAAAPSVTHTRASTNSEGVATSFARSDHEHNITWNVPACRVYNSANISIPDATETLVTFNSERYDTDTMHSTAVNTSRITFTTAGLYLVVFSGVMDTNSDYTTQYCALRLNGATVIGYAPASRGAGGGPIFNLSSVYKYSAADYVEMLVWQDNTTNAARNLLTAANSSPEISATWIGTGN